MAPVPFAFAAFLALVAIVLSGFCLAYAVGLDADARGSNGLIWGLFTLALPPVTPIVYLGYRTRLPTRDEPTSRLERWAGTMGIGFTSAYALTAVLVPPDPSTHLAFGGALAVITIPAAYVLCYQPDRRAIGS
ncbi:uncharacterized protein Nmag_0513 [Natrialba magadii ATCC 43099]|uniref:Uncharacterized protein n=1 Tax=Natrialba magadii (strain ATCC 43099 / DSM 3394 / CCM 3739 / CIP 104546 / IAM 13178 / JCM 8861 / NBRC 102185 / NCIMB 2190 / MS3) TaxID=547559 RepID=D3SYI9_NATMM|nr:hypothetical protein [Natrialba magadii]ADD04100.1 uncharacterized protein Nmag_0513 [Natrialba magadii ATCC 43099]ELY33257.1 hypothetical protein C500_02974 [Natrialba magadii ATCC 43099]